MSIPQPDPEATLYGLTPGGLYRIVLPFMDYYTNVFAPGEILRFVRRHFLPYEGGHTLVFEERAMYLQETQQRHIIDQFSAYIARIDPA